MDFKSVLWPAVKEKVLSFVEEQVSQKLQAMLDERNAELESLTRAPLLKADSPLEVYQAYVRFFQNRIGASGKESSVIRRSEVVMSLAMSLEQGLETRLRQHLNQIGANGDEQGKGSTMTDDKGGKKETEEEENTDDEATTIIDDDDDDSDYYDDPNDIDEEDNILPSIESFTPIVSPTSLAQLRRYEKRYLESVRSAEVQRETHSRVLSSVDRHSATKTTSENLTEPLRTPNSLAIRRKMRDPDETPSRIIGQSKNTLVNRKRELEETPTPTQKVNKRARRDKHSPSVAHSRASSGSSYFPSIEELFSSSLGTNSSPATQQSQGQTKPSSLVSSRVLNPALNESKSKGKEPEDDREKARPTSKPPVPRFGESPGLFVTPSPASGSTNKPFTFKRSKSRNARKPSQAQHENMQPSRCRETTADFEALNTSEKLSLLFQMSRGKET